jgi:hypothetical protein
LAVGAGADVWPVLADVAHEVRSRAVTAPKTAAAVRVRGGMA